MSTPFDHFQFHAGALKADGIALESLAREHGTPLYVYSADAFLEPLREIQKGLSSLDLLVCFAMKANSNLALIRMLGQAGAGMDLVSGGELFRALRAGVSPDRIVFSGVGKTPDEMAYALEQGIFSFNVESGAELEALSTVAARLGKKAQVAIRFNPDVDAKTHPYISTGLKKNKFGIQRPEILKIARAIREQPQDYPGIVLRGLSIHIGSQLLSLSPLEDAFKKLKSLVKDLDEILPEPLQFVDLGGGVGITYKNEKAPSLQKYCAMIVKHFGPKAKLARKLKILIEPGRTLSGNSGVLLSRVLYRKERGKKSFLVIDAAMNDLMRPALYGSFHDIVPVDQKKAKSRKQDTDIVGPICESSDCFASGRKFPASVESGDIVAILSAGAYGFTMSSNYNTRPRPAEVLVAGGRARVIRERETYEDLIRGEGNT